MFHVQHPTPSSHRSLSNSLQAHQSPFSSHHTLYEDLSYPCRSLPCITSHHNSAFVYVFSLQVWEHLQRRNLVLKSAISQVPSTVTEMECWLNLGSITQAQTTSKLSVRGPLFTDRGGDHLIPSRQPSRGPHVTRGCHVTSAVHSGSSSLRKT